MLVIKKSSELQKIITKIKSSNRIISFVPTMGNLHEGHLTLISLAHQNASVVIVSIFVNPLQFTQSDDLINYPRTLEHDIKYCEDNKVDIVFAPSVDDIYPDECEKVKIELPEVTLISDSLEGAFRPGYFSGVITVVKKLFELVQPDTAIFGEKDYQQLLVIRKMVEILNLPITIIASKTIREADGLAMSSRNSKLSVSERKQATQLYDVLQSIRELIASGNIDYTLLTKNGVLKLSENGFQVDYLVVSDCDDLQQSLAINSKKRVILVAAWLGKTRLIDSLLV